MPDDGKKHVELCCGLVYFSNLQKHDSVFSLVVEWLELFIVPVIPFMKESSVSIRNET